MYLLDVLCLIRVCVCVQIVTYFLFHTPQLQLSSCWAFSIDVMLQQAGLNGQTGEIRKIIQCQNIICLSQFSKWWNKSSVPSAEL